MKYKNLIHNQLELSFNMTNPLVIPYSHYLSIPIYAILIALLSLLYQFSPFSNVFSEILIQCWYSNFVFFLFLLIIIFYFRFIMFYFILFLSFTFFFYFMRTTQSGFERKLYRRESNPHFLNWMKNTFLCFHSKDVNER